MDFNLCDFLQSKFAGKGIQFEEKVEKSDLLWLPWMDEFDLMLYCWICFWSFQINQL